MKLSCPPNRIPQQTTELIFSSQIAGEREEAYWYRDRSRVCSVHQPHCCMYHRQQNKCYPQSVYLPISKLHSILAVAYLLAQNNKSQIFYCGQNWLQSTAVNCTSSENLTPLGVAFILLAMVHYLLDIYLGIWQNHIPCLRDDFTWLELQLIFYS